MYTFSGPILARKSRISGASAILQMAAVVVLQLSLTSDFEIWMVE